MVSQLLIWLLYGEIALFEYGEVDEAIYWASVLSNRISTGLEKRLLVIAMEAEMDSGRKENKKINTEFKSNPSELYDSYS